MGPQSLIGQAAGAMNSGAPALDQVSNTAPTFQPGLQSPPSAPMPQKSPMSEMTKSALHRAFDRRGKPYPAQLQGQTTSPSSGGTVTMPSVQDTNPNEAGTQIPLTEAERIVKVLEKRLDRHNKTEDAMVNHIFPKVGPESQDALKGMSENMNSGKGISVEDNHVLDSHAKEQLKIPSKTMSSMSPAQKLAELLGAIQSPRGDVTNG